MIKRATFDRPRRELATRELPPLALSMGEPAGIGPEICVQTWLQRTERKLPRFYLIGDPERFRQAAADLSTDLKFIEISAATEVNDVAVDCCPVLRVPLAEPVRTGQPSTKNAEAVLKCIRQGVADSVAGRASGLVTAPINKEILAKAGFAHPGHTEFVAELSGGAKPVMLLAGADLKVIPVTIHLPLRDAIDSLSSDLIIETGRIAASSMRVDFGILEPRLAVAGLNPHAGENGILGAEDSEIIAPAVRQLMAEGIDIVGPLPADTMFHPPARKKFDVALCMYHDQANIPVKTIAFDEGVNCTIGLPIVRTSPDHGTAFDLAGSGKASANSMIAAVELAWSISENRAHVP